VDLSAPPRERWEEAAEKFGDKIHKLHQHVDEVADDFCDTSWWRTLRLLRRGILDPLSMMVRWFGQDYAYEIKGISRTVGLPYGELVAMNLLYDISQGCCSGACSSASFVTKRQRPVLARNMDWPCPDSIGEHTVICRMHKNGSFYTSVGVAGFVGVLSAQRN